MNIIVLVTEELTLDRRILSEITADIKRKERKNENAEIFDFDCSCRFRF